MINTDTFSSDLRERSVRRATKQLLITNFIDTSQAHDLSEPPNCRGFGRVRHFTRTTSNGWPENTLPIKPACAALGIEPVERLNAQVFQNAVCNWRCWYCYVPFNLLNANPERSAWATADELVGWYLEQADRPQVIDLSGGQPDLIPEWTLWMVQSLLDRGLANSTYLWIDDNLSNDYFWRHLTDSEIAEIVDYPALGRVGCFKGFDESSFAFNTAAAPELFNRQFELLARHVRSGIDTYAYATFTSPSDADPRSEMSRFVDRLQVISETLPLRLIPLEVSEWGPVTSRMRIRHRSAIDNQNRAVEAWSRELESRFSSSQRDLPINEVPR